MSKDKKNKKSSEILELEEGGDLLFNEEEMEEVVDALAETTLVNAVVEEDVSSTVIPSQGQEEEIQKLLGALGKTGEESPEDSLQAFSKSGEDEEWKPAVVVEAEKSATKKQVAGAHPKVEVYSSKKIPMGTPVGLPRPGNVPRIRKDLGGVQEFLGEDGTSKLKAVPMDGNTLTSPVAEIAESAQDKEFFRGGGDTPPNGFEAVEKDDENRLGDTWVDADPSWIAQNSSKLAGVGILAIVGVIVLLVVLSLVPAKAPNMTTEDQVADNSATSSEELLPPVSESSSEDEKLEEVAEESVSNSDAYEITQGTADETALVVVENAEDVLEAISAESVLEEVEGEVVAETKEEFDYSEMYENTQGKVRGLAMDVELFAVNILDMVSETSGLTVRNPVAESEVAKIEEADLDDLDIEFQVSDEPSDKEVDPLDIDYTNPRNEDDCVAVMSRAGTDEVGEFEGMLCCRNLQILSGKDVTDCQIRVQNF